MVAKHRKVHLFDIDIPGRQKFKVSQPDWASGEEDSQVACTQSDSPLERRRDGRIGQLLCALHIRAPRCRAFDEPMSIASIKH